MLKHRVVVTGMGSVSPFGIGVEALWEGFIQNRSAVTAMPADASPAGVRSLLCGLVGNIPSASIPRTIRRTMSRMSQYAYLAAREALEMAQASETLVTGGRMGVVAGSTIGSVDGLEEFFGPYLGSKSVEAVKSTLFFKVMNHSAAANLVQALGVTGPVIAPSAACATGCQSIGLAAQMVSAGLIQAALCGGTDEYHSLTTATFDIMNAASTAYNDDPTLSPRPFDKNRDGVVCAEGCGMVILESLESARNRNAPLFAEVLGFASNADSSHIANPGSASIEQCMRMALADAGIEPHQVDAVNAHATGTHQGDAAEGQAIASVFGQDVPVNSLKGHLGHTMAASGSLESIASILSMRAGLVLPTRNLCSPDPACGKIQHVITPIHKELKIMVKNSFALGGINAVLVLGKVPRD